MPHADLGLARTAGRSLVIAAGYAVDPLIGLVTTLAVFLHEVPQEIGDFGILIHLGLAPKGAILLNFL